MDTGDSGEQDRQGPSPQIREILKCLLALREGKAYQHYIMHLDNPLLGPWKLGLVLSPHLNNMIFPPTFLSSMSHSQPTEAVMQLPVAVLAAELNTLSQTSHLEGQLSTWSEFSGTELPKHRSDLVNSPCSETSNGTQSHWHYNLKLSVSLITNYHPSLACTVHFNHKSGYKLGLFRSGF